MDDWFAMGDAPALRGGLGGRLGRNGKDKVWLHWHLLARALSTIWLLRLRRGQHESVVHGTVVDRVTN